MTGRLTRSQRRQLEQETNQKIDLNELNSLDVEENLTAKKVPAKTPTASKRSTKKATTTTHGKGEATTVEMEAPRATETSNNDEIKLTADVSEEQDDTSSVSSIESSDSGSDEESDSEEDDEEEEDEDLDELLNKAQQAILSKKAETIELDKSDVDRMDNIDTRHMKLNAGISLKEELYIKKDASGRPKLSSETVAFIDDDSKKSKDVSKKASLILKPSKDDDTFMTKKQRQAEREKTTGKAWFDMPRAEITDEVKRDLQILKMRHILDRKRHYKKMGKRPDPKYFQIGTIVEGPTEFYSSRLTKKERKQTIVDELLANEESKQYYKRKFSEVQERTNSGGKKHFKKLKAKRQWAK